MSDACNFARDVQELGKRGPFTKDQMDELLELRKGIIRNDGGILITVDFPDRSTAVWSDEKQSFTVTSTRAYKKVNVLTEEQITTFRSVVKFVLDMEEKYQKIGDFDSMLGLLKGLHGCVSDDDFSQFSGIILAASDKEMRCPK